MHPTRRARPFATLLLAVGVLAALTACAPPAGSAVASTPAGSESAGPSPTASEPPHAPDVSALMLTPNGMGTLVIGEAPSTDPAAQMLEQDPAACSDERTGFGAGVEPGDPEALRWVPIAPYLSDEGDPHWSVDVVDGILTRIDLHDSSVPTDAGVRIGDSRAAALAAYPGVDAVVEWGTDVFVIPGEHGVLHIEIARDPGGASAGYWGDQIDTVVFIRAVDLASSVYSVAASENIAGSCF